MYLISLALPLSLADVETCRRIYAIEFTLVRACDSVYGYCPLTHSCLTADPAATIVHHRSRCP